MISITYSFNQLPSRGGIYGRVTALRRPQFYDIPVPQNFASALASRNLTADRTCNSFRVTETSYRISASLHVVPAPATQTRVSVAGHLNFLDLPRPIWAECAPFRRRLEIIRGAARRPPPGARFHRSVRRRWIRELNAAGLRAGTRRLRFDGKRQALIDWFATDAISSARPVAKPGVNAIGQLLRDGS